jgi:hypothetical protein
VGSCKINTSDPGRIDVLKMYIRLRHEESVAQNAYPNETKGVLWRFTRQDGRTDRACRNM